MAQRTELEAAPRTVLGKATKHLRKSGIIPANIYGHKEPSQAIQVDAVEFEKLRRSRATRHVLNLRLPKGKAQTVLIRHIEHNPVSGIILHVDFARVSLTERITTKVPLHFVGEAPGVKSEGGVLLTLLEALEVECRAGDIIEGIDVDISSLAEIDSLLHAKDVALPGGFTLITDPEEAIAKVASTRAVATAEEAAPAAAEATPAPAASTTSTGE
ncbi:MAG TPA: 50S ribosomal protein L25 [Ktedonosporobacter sp.]|nr:50S ribosomal protein L25 [Ktedonosporobacter sp.]